MFRASISDQTMALQVLPCLSKPVKKRPLPGMACSVYVRRDVFFLLFKVRTWRERWPQRRVPKPQPAQKDWGRP